jgi:hypothetical protein
MGLSRSGRSPHRLLIKHSIGVSGIGFIPSAGGGSRSSASIPTPRLTTS